MWIVLIIAGAILLLCIMYGCCSKYRLKDARYCEKDSFYVILVVEVEPGWMGIFTGSREIEFRGSCTVWHIMPSMRRCSSFLEAILADFWTKAKYDGIRH